MGQRARASVRVGQGGNVGGGKLSPSATAGGGVSRPERSEEGKSGLGREIGTNTRVLAAIEQH